MFETSVIPLQSQSSHRYRFLTLSFVAHGCALAAVIAATLTNVTLPVDAPRQMATPILLRPVTLPPALGSRQPQAPRPKASIAAAVRMPATAVVPAVIPEQAHPVTPADSSSMSTTAVTSTDAAGGTGSGEGVGVPEGVPGGVGTDAGSGAGEVAPIRVIGDVKPPVVIRRVLPDYPRVAVRGHMSGWVIVECIIDKTGHIRDAKVLRSSFGAFDQPALEAVQQWVFSPGSLHGEAVDTIFDLTVTFQIR